MLNFEMVIPDQREKYDAFLESFDTKIKKANIRIITRIKDCEWNIPYAGGWSGNGLSINIFIYQKRNDLICRVNGGKLHSTDKYEVKIELEIRKAIIEVQKEILMNSTTKTTPPFEEVKIELMDCPRCGRAISKEVNFCPYCGSEIK